MCGNSVWEAAANVARRKAQLDETGLYLSSCRHQVTQKALNMYRGEIYAYPLVLQQQFLSPPTTFFWQDVVCKYWPWLRKRKPELTTSMTPALSVMHGKGHAWYCEVSSPSYFANACHQMCGAISYICCILDRLL